MPRYRILWTAPVLERTGEVQMEDGKPVKPHRVLAWPCRAETDAKDEFAALAEAKRRYGGSPVIEEATHYV